MLFCVMAYILLYGRRVQNLDPVLYNILYSAHTACTVDHDVQWKDDPNYIPPPPEMFCKEAQQNAANSCSQKCTVHRLAPGSYHDISTVQYLLGQWRMAARLKLVLGLSHEPHLEYISIAIWGLPGTKAAMRSVQRSVQRSTVSYCTVRIH